MVDLERFCIKFGDLTASVLDIMRKKDKHTNGGEITYLRHCRRLGELCNRYIHHAFNTTQNTNDLQLNMIY